MVLLVPSVNVCSNQSSISAELDKLLEDAPLPFIMQHAARISGVRKRITSLNSLLKSIQRRLDNIDHTLSAGLIHGTIIFHDTYCVKLFHDNSNRMYAGFILYLD